MIRYSLRFSAVLDISHCGLLHLFRGAGVVVDSVTEICNAIMKCVFIVKRSCIYKGCLGVLECGAHAVSHSAWLKLAAAPVCFLSAVIQQIECFLTHVHKDGFC